MAVKYAAIVIPVFLGLLPSAFALIDLTPEASEQVENGVAFRQLTFKTDHGTIVYTPPRGWNVDGGKNRLQISAPKSDFAEGVIQTAPLLRPQPFDEATVASLEQQVLRDVPPGSQSVQLVNRLENPILLDHNPSYEFVTAYQVLGRLFQRSTIFVYTADTQLVFRFSAPKSDFDQLNHLFRGSIISWQWISTPTGAASQPPGPAPAH